MSSCFFPNYPNVVRSIPSFYPEEVPKEILRVFPNPKKISQLSGGWVNKCYRVQTAKGVFAFRVGKPHPENYGINRDRELQWYREGERLGLAPPLREWDPSNGVLVMDYIEGPLVDEFLIRQNNGIAKVAELLRKLHTVRCKEEGREPITFILIRTHLEKLKTLGVLPEKWEPAIREIMAKTSISQPLVLCHNDLAYNMLLERDRLWAVDWECAGWNDPLFDLAPLCIWYEFSKQEKQALLIAYFGELKQEKELDQAIRLVLVFSALWSLLEVAYGDESYREKAMKLFAKASA